MLTATVLVPLSTVGLLRRHPLDWCRRHRVRGLFLGGLAAVLYAIAVGNMLADANGPGANTVGFPLLVIFVLGLIAWFVALALFAARGYRRLLRRPHRRSPVSAAPTPRRLRARTARTPKQQAALDKVAERPAWAVLKLALWWGALMWLTRYQRVDQRTLVVLGATSLGLGITLTAWVLWSERQRKMRAPDRIGSFNATRGLVGPPDGSDEPLDQSARRIAWLKAIAVAFILVEIVGLSLRRIGVHPPGLVGFGLLIVLAPVVHRLRRGR